MSMRQTIRKIINEDNKMREPIRKIVRDIITVFKFEDEGEFFLPEYFDDRDSMIYDFLGLNPFSVELIIDYGNYGVNAYYSRDDETIVVKIQYDEGDKNSILYKLIGDLNETVAHELRHIKQNKTGMFDLDVKEPDTPLEYYTQEHEIDSQYFGFKRLSKLLRKPLEEIVKNWFETNREIHRLNDDEIEIVIDKILTHK